MLSRVANCLYWMVRYVERADDLARLIKVNEQLLLELDRDTGRGFDQLWRPLLMAAGDETLYSELSGGDGLEVIEFLTTDPRNPNSILACIDQGRENARMVRDQLSESLWEELNGLYITLHSEDGQRLLSNNPSEYYETITRAAFTFHGIAASTITRDEGWEFMDIGRHLERADMTTRFLDISNYLPQDADPTLFTGEYHWGAILRSCGGLSAHRSIYRGQINAETVCQQLLFSPDFPRSARYCLERADIALHAISGTPRGTYSNEAERLCGRVLAELSYANLSEILGRGLHDFLDNLQTQFNEIGSHLFRAYFLLDAEIDRRQIQPHPAPVLASWQIQQQQQQQ